MGLVSRLAVAMSALVCAGGLAGCELVFPPPGDDDTPPEGTAEARVHVDNPSGETYVDFPVLVELDADAIDVDLVGEPTLDLRFVAAASTSGTSPEDLPFEVDTWDPGGKSYVWVRVPELNAGSRTELRMFYGP